MKHKMTGQNMFKKLKGELEKEAVRIDSTKIYQIALKKNKTIL